MNSFKNDTSLFLKKVRSHLSGDPPLKSRDISQSPLRLLIIIPASIFGCELLVMYFVSFISHSFWINGLVDATILLLLIFPLLYIFVFRPLILHIDDHKCTEETLQKSTHDLGERVKELNCLYSLSSLIEKPDISLNDIFKGITNLIPPSWQYPEITCARIIFEDKEYKTKNFKETTWKQACEIAVDNKELGNVEIFYLEERPDIDEGPFLKEERALIEAICERLGHVVERVKAEQELHDSEKRYRSLIETMKDGLATQDEDGNLIFVNKSLCQMLEYSKDELIGKPAIELYDEVNRDIFNNKMLKRKTGISQSYEIEFTCSDGRKIPTIVSGQPILDVDGQYKGSFAVITDISELKHAEEDKKKIETQLLQSEKMASVGQLAAGVAHEINNPTGFVSSNLRSLSEYTKDISELTGEYRKLIAELQKTMPKNEDLQPISKQVKRINTLEAKVDIDFIMNDISELIKESREGTDRIKTIVADLKNYAHPGEDKPQFTDINNNLDSTLNMVWNELKYKAKVIKDYGNLPEVKCYPQQLNQIFANLLVNAAQAIEEQGEIFISTIPDDGFVKISIKDTGLGIPEENLSKVFDPFFTTKEVGKGTGLGLNVAYNIIQKHKGSINVESKADKGTTFTIRIPVEMESIDGT